MTIPKFTDEYLLGFIQRTRENAAAIKAADAKGDFKESNRLGEIVTGVKGKIGWVLSPKERARLDALTHG